MRRKHENIKEFKNGNLAIRSPIEYRKDLKSGNHAALEVISWLLDELDCYLVGEPFCLSNFAIGQDIHNANMDLMYTLNFNDILDALAAGRWLRLYARELDETDRELINEWEV